MDEAFEVPKLSRSVKYSPEYTKSAETELGDFYLTIWTPNIFTTGWVKRVQIQHRPRRELCLPNCYGAFHGSTSR